MSTTASKEIESFAKIAEIKRILTTLSTDFLKTKPKCLVVTSAIRSEGKTTTHSYSGSNGSSSKRLPCTCSRPKLAQISFAYLFRT